MNAVDANWNLVTATDSVGITSSDSGASLPSSASLVAGTKVFSITLNTAGNFTVTATDATNGSKTANTSPAIAVNSSQLIQATGGSAISADGATGTWTTLTGPTYTENANGNVGTGTIILYAPSGFIFDTNGIAPSVLITRVTSGSGGKSDIAGSVTSVSTNRT